MTPTEQDLRQQLEDLDLLRLQRGWRYSSPQRFVLEEGRFFPPHPVPPGMWEGRPRCCFDNAITVAILYDVPYIEGYALLGLGDQTIALHHAWNIDHQGRVIDVTWHPLVGLAYLGVAFAPERADDATWNADGTVLQDYKRRYPLLREPWHGEPPDQVWPYSPRLARIRRLKQRQLPQEVSMIDTATCCTQHPLDAAHSPTPAMSGQVVYVVCGFRGCQSRTAVDAAVWEAERARRQAQSAMVQVWHARGDMLVPVAPDACGLVPPAREEA